MAAEFDADLPDYVRSNPDYKAARLFKEIVQPKGGVDYDWVYDYAIEQYDREMKSWSQLEEKANDIIKYFGTGAGIFALVSAVGAKPETIHLVAAALPAMLVAWLSVLVAANARRPTERSFPPSIEGAFHYATAYDKEARVRFVGQLHFVCKAIAIGRRKKAQLVESATRLYVLAVALLIVPVLVAIFYPPASKPDSPALVVRPLQSQPAGP